MRLTKAEYREMDNAIAFMVWTKINFWSVSTAKDIKYIAKNSNLGKNTRDGKYIPSG